MIFETFKRKILDLYQYWTGLNYNKYIFISTFLILVLTIPFAVLFEFIGINEAELGGPKMEELGFGRSFMLAVVIAPILETLLGQLIPIKIVQKYVKWKTNIIAIITSSLFFALGHFSYSFWYFLLILPMGFVLSVTYITFQKRTQSSFWTTVIVHSARNLIAVLFSIGGLTH